MPYKCDVTDSAQVAACAQAVEKEFGKVDILVNCAGAGHNDWALSLTDEKWLATMDACLNSTFYCDREFANVMKNQNYGRIINIASMLGSIALDKSFGRGICEYSASKGAVINLTRQLANEWAQYGITVNTLSPGFFASEQSPVGQGWFNDFINVWCPMKRPGKNSELDAAIVFMASEEASYMTGQNIVIDGGWTAV
jgi:gluconate 5-dehydrogenase